MKSWVRKRLNLKKHYWSGHERVRLRELVISKKCEHKHWNGTSATDVAVVARGGLHIHCSGGRGLCEAEERNGELWWSRSWGMFSIFRCTSISWIHFGESLNQSDSDVLDFFLQIMPDIVSDCHHCQYCQQLVVNIGCRLDICQKKIAQPQFLRQILRQKLRNSRHLLFCSKSE